MNVVRRPGYFCWEVPFGNECVIEVVSGPGTPEFKTRPWVSYVTG